jgi:hypothetical protein
MSLLKEVGRFFTETKLQREERQLQERETAYQESDRWMDHILELNEAWLAENREKRAKGSKSYAPSGEPKYMFLNHWYRNKAGNKVRFYELEPELQEEINTRDRESGRASNEAAKKATQEHRESELNRLRDRVNRLRTR